MRHKYLACFMVAISASTRLSAVAADIGTAFTYQGSLENASGQVTDVCVFRFGLWSSAGGGNEVGDSPQIVNGVGVTAGVFTTSVDFGVDAINGTARWLEIEVQCPGDPDFVLLSPRVELTPAPHALALPGLYTQQNAISPNLIGGFSGNTVTAGVYGATISGGGSAEAGNFNNRVTDYFGIVGGGRNNQAGDDSGLTTDRGFCTVGGGVDNTASGAFSTVGGGVNNIAGGGSSTVAGGERNRANGVFATAAGGADNTADGWYSFAAGFRGKANNDGTFVWSDSSENADFASTGPNQFLIRAAGGVGINNVSPTQALDVTGNIHASGTIASGSSITIDGTSGSERISSSASLDLRTAAGRALRLENTTGSPNIIGGHPENIVTPGVGGATIAGGGAGSVPNRVTDNYGTVGGGRDNQAGDGTGTTADRHYATVGGGDNNTASGQKSTVGGGTVNIASGLEATVGGGISNDASGSRSFVGGGDNNEARGSHSTVPGGLANWAGGDRSFAAGQGARVRDAATAGDADGDQGTFIWADASTALVFASTGPNQFLIRATGGVGIGTNAPAAQLDVVASSGNGIQATTATNDGIRGVANGGGGAGVAGFANAASVFAAGYFSNTAGGRGLFVGGLSEFVRSGASVATFDRGSNDGAVIEIKQAGTTEGTISVSGTTVSYNAFTGSHYAWTNERVERGMLVVMTGENRRKHQNGLEPIYGVTTSTFANDSKCLGAYLGLLEPNEPMSLDNPHQIMAVGNGDMWVVDSGRNIEPGQYLISSDLRGHAMLDDAAKFDVGHVIARASERIDWSTVNETTEGRKHKRIAVFFENFDRGAGAELIRTVEKQKLQIDVLEEELSALRSLMKPSKAGLVDGIGSAAGLGVVLLAFATLVANRRGSAR